MMAQLSDMYQSTGGAVLRKRTDQYKRKVNLLKNGDFQRIDGHVYMPTDSEISTLRKTQPGQFRKGVEFSASMSEDAAKKKLQETFPYLENTSFVCAAVVKLDKEHKKLEFYGPPRLWNGETIRKKITGNSALYILEDEVPDSETELNATKMPLGDDNVVSNISTNVNQMSLRDDSRMEVNENHQESSSDESATVQHLSQVQISYSSEEGTSLIDSASTSGIGAEFLEGDDDVARNISTNINQMSLRDDSQMEVDENHQESLIDENKTVQHLSQVQMISDSSGIDNLRSYSDTQDFMNGISESGAEPDDWFQSQSWTTGFVPLKVESATPDTVPLQGGKFCCFTFNQPLPRDVQSGFAMFGPLGTVDVYRCRDDSLVGMQP